jgi:hypothetical protein
MVTSATTIEYRIRDNQVSSCHSAITALQLIEFQVCPCRQPSRSGPQVANTKTTSSRFQNVQRPSPRIECRRWLQSQMPAHQWKVAVAMMIAFRVNMEKPGSWKTAVAVLRNQTGHQIMQLNRKDQSHNQIFGYSVKLDFIF